MREQRDFLTTSPDPLHSPQRSADCHSVIDWLIHVKRRFDWFSSGNVTRRLMRSGHRGNSLIRISSARNTADFLPLVWVHNLLYYDLLFWCGHITETNMITFVEQNRTPTWFSYSLNPTLCKVAVFSETHSFVSFFTMVVKQERNANRVRERLCLINVVCFFLVLQTLLKPGNNLLQINISWSDRIANNTSHIIMKQSYSHDTPIL